MRLLQIGILAVSILATASCATVMNGTTQHVMVTSVPSGAQVLLDGQPVGTTPTEVAVRRYQREPVIRTEMKNFGAREHRLQRSESRWLLGDLAIGIALFPYVRRAVAECDECTSDFVGHMIAGAVTLAPLIVDYLNGTAFKFPARIDTVLVPAQDRRLTVPSRLRTELRGALARKAAPTVAVRSMVRGAAPNGSAFGRSLRPNSAPPSGSSSSCRRASRRWSTHLGQDLGLVARRLEGAPGLGEGVEESSRSDPATGRAARATDDQGVATLQDVGDNCKFHPRSSTALGTTPRSRRSAVAPRGVPSSARARGSPGPARHQRAGGATTRRPPTEPFGRAIRQNVQRW